MQTLIPQPATATATPSSRFGRTLGRGLTPLALGLYLVGFALALPAFWHPKQIWFMLAWDGLLTALVLLDALALPSPETLTITRTFRDSPQLGEPTLIELTVNHNTNGILDLRLTDDLHPALTPEPTTKHLEVFPHDPARISLTVIPNQRGDIILGRIYLRYRSFLQLAERWASALPSTSASAVTSSTSGPWALNPGPSPQASPQSIRVFPAHDDTHGNTELLLLRARQLEMQKRRLRLRGTGRDFESLRDYAQGDELRNVSWTATARRGRLVTRQFTVERSQQVWIVLDCGRLSRTALQLRRTDPVLVHETEAERNQSAHLTITQLDEAATAATMLAQVISSSGDKFGLLTYGRTVQQLLPPGLGPTHLRLLIDQLSQTHSEAAEADHLHAVARLKTVQRRRGLILWITELVDQAGRPELIAAAAELTRRHLVVLVLLEHPELEQLAGATPKTRDEMYSIAAAQEMLDRRREAIARLERAGVLIVETTPEEAGAEAIRKYLEIKARGLL
jgi:uncharacterized protein (DUF58 family)